LAKPARKELERSWRVFLRYPDAAFRRVTDSAEAGRVYADLVRLQRRRAAETGLAYALDGPDHDRFYRRLLETGLGDGSTILTALTAAGAGVGGGEGDGTQTVAALLGVADGRRYVMVRICDAGDDWKACSPGRVLIERTLEHLHRSPAGYRVFDFGLGDYAYKRRFAVAPTPLVDLTVALSARGLPRLGQDRAKALVRRRPTIARAARRAVATAVASRSLILGGRPLPPR
jgi:CelD/BcsL family acetyltransferase involved in cellulose biosynthesis